MDIDENQTNRVGESDLFTSISHAHFIIAGPCVLENYDLAISVADTVAEVATKTGLIAIFKSSWDKANRSSKSGFRGPGLEKGCEILRMIKEKTHLPILTDIHLSDEANYVAQVADVLQIPAFLCRQTDLLLAAGRSGAIVNVKKGQFMAPWDMRGVIDKISSTGNKFICLTERGTTFGYNNLVVDFRSISIMKKMGFPVIFDATHSVQLPGAGGTCSGGDRSHVPALARAAAAVGVDGIFMECHPNPDKALCDGPNSWYSHKLLPLVEELKMIWEIPNEAMPRD